MQNKNAVIKAKDSVIKALDQNGNGEVDINDIITLAFKTPGRSYQKSELFTKGAIQEPSAGGDRCCDRDDTRTGGDIVC